MSEKEEPRELNPFTMDYRQSGFDFAPHPVEVTAPEEEPVPKDSSVAVSADSSEKPDGDTQTPVEQPTVHPSQLPPSEPIVSVEKDNGLPKVPAILKHPSLPETKTG